MVKNFLHNLTNSLQNYLPDNWENEGLPNLRIVKKYPWGKGIIHIQTTVKGFPSCNLFLGYGVSHNVLTPILDKINIAVGYKSITTEQFFTDTRNNRLNPYLTTVFVEDYKNCDYDDTISRIMENSYENLLTFFERFGNLRNIRNSVENNEGDFFSLNRAVDIIAIDYALSDFEHLFWFRYEKANSSEIYYLEYLAKVLGIKI
jgi:hypothetical protein